MALPTKPTPVVDENGRKVYPGSLSMSVELTPGQKDQIKKLLQEGPETPSSIITKIDTLPNYNPHSGESVRRWLSQLEQGGTVKQAKDKDGRLIGWEWAAKDE
jgi:hypothetical protein